MGGMTATQDDERFRAAGVRLSQTRQAAHESYSKAADLVRERLVEVQKVLGHPPRREAAEAALRVAQELRALTERELDEANATWTEWLGEAHAREEDARLRRQEKATTSATWAAWGSAVAALAALAMSIWNLWNGRAP